MSPSKRSVLCHLCQENVMSISNLNKHLQEKHEMTINKSELYFKSLAEFNDWKKKEETRSKANFRSFSTDKNKITGCVFKRYVCNRTGKKYNWQYKNERNRRSKGTCRTDYHCASYIKLEIKNETTLKCIYWSTHTTHENDIVFLRIPEEDEMDISQKIKIGIEPEMILEQIRNSVGVETKIKHLLTRKALRNIAKKHGVYDQFQMNTRSDMSVDFWVQKYEKSESNPILLYKKQGVNLAPFDEDDFILVIMTQSQEEMLKKSSHKVCIENTRGKPKFNLTTLITTDEFGEWFPAAFCISLKLDEIHIGEFFAKIRDKVGIITPKVFMSDGTATYWNAWTRVMIEIPEHFLLSIWHVDEDWGDSLKKISATKGKSYVYETLRILLKEPNELTFKELLYSFIQKLSVEPELYDFYQYFVTYYAGRPEMWAGCYRQKYFVNTDIMLEEFHDVLKQTYIGGKKTERFDKVIMKLLEIPRDKFYSRVGKFCDFSQINRFVSEINKRHRRAEAIPISDVVKMSERIWIVQSQYVVKKKDNLMTNAGGGGVGECNCNILCIECNVCIHSFCCTCCDYEIMNNMCEHIHSVGIYYLAALMINGSGDDGGGIDHLDGITHSDSEENDEVCTLIQKVEPFESGTATNMEQAIQILSTILQLAQSVANRNILESEFKVIKTNAECIKGILTKKMKNAS